MVRLNVKPAGAVSIRIGNSAIGMTVSKAALVSGERDRYEGSYEVIPKVEAQTLETANKFLKQNVSVFGIPYYDVSNNSGGSTIYIGSEVLTDGN